MKAADYRAKHMTEDDKSPDIQSFRGKIEAAPKSATNTLQGLTRSLEIARRG